MVISALRLDLRATAVELEHDTFQHAKAANLYKASVLKKVAKIHQASKDGQLYDVGGDAKRCSAQAEPPEPTEYDIRPASQVYSVSSALASTPDLGLGKAPLPCALSQGPASGPLLA